MKTIQIATATEEIFSESKKGLNYGILAIFGAGLILVIFAVALVIALLLILAEIYFGPLEAIFGYNITSIISWLMNYQWFVVGLAVFVFIYCWICNKVDKTILNPT